MAIGCFVNNKRFWQFKVEIFLFKLTNLLISIFDIWHPNDFPSSPYEYFEPNLYIEIRRM